MQDTVIKRRPTERVDYMIEKMEYLISRFPQFGYSSILGKLAQNWPAKTVENNFRYRGLEILVSDRKNSQSLDRLISSMFLDPEIDDDTIFLLRDACLEVQASVTADIPSTQNPEPTNESVGVTMVTSF